MAALNEFFQKGPEFKIRHHFVIAKLAPTLTFFEQNFSQMHHFGIATVFMTKISFNVSFQAF